jgi:hypothetical protein
LFHEVGWVRALFPKMNQVLVVDVAVELCDDVISLLGTGAVDTRVVVEGRHLHILEPPLDVLSVFSQSPCLIFDLLKGEGISLLVQWPIIFIALCQYS